MISGFDGAGGDVRWTRHEENCNGFQVTATIDSEGYGFGLCTDKIQANDMFVAVGLDNSTQSHLYQLDVTPSVEWRLSRDGEFIVEGSGDLPDPNGVFVGDGTGGATPGCVPVTDRKLELPPSG